MLCAIRKKGQEKVIAKDEVKDNAPFICSNCFKTVILRKGKINIHHFAHKPPVTCAYGIGEKEVHRKCKTEFYEFLLNNTKASKVELERNLKTVRPDVSAYINDVPVAIEVQTSSLSINEIIRRTNE